MTVNAANANINAALITDTKELLESFNVGIVGIMPNDTSAYPEDSFENMVSFSTKYGMPFPYLIDETQSVAHDYGAVCTPDFFCFNSDLLLRYRGRFADMSNGAPLAKRSELFEAVKIIAVSGEGPAIQTPSIGCSIKWRNVV